MGRFNHQLVIEPSWVENSKITAWIDLGIEFPSLTRSLVTGLYTGMCLTIRGPKSKSFSARLDYVLAIEGVSIFATSSHILYLITYIHDTHLDNFCSSQLTLSFKDSSRNRGLMVLPRKFVLAPFPKACHDNFRTIASNDL